VSNETKGRALAEAVRQACGLGDASIGDLFEFVYEVHQIDVLSLDVEPDEHGLSMHDPSTGHTMIAVATTSHPMRQRSSIAHELGHVLAGDLASESPALVPGERSDAEITADAFARHLLLPLSAVRAYVEVVAGGRVGLVDLSFLVQHYGVSPQVAAIQLREAGAIDQGTCAEWSQMSAGLLSSEFGWRDQYRAMSDASQRPRSPQGLAARAVAGYRRGLLGIAEVALWYGSAADDLQDELGPIESADDGWVDDDSGPLFPGASEPTS